MSTTKQRYEERAVNWGKVMLWTTDYLEIESMNGTEYLDCAEFPYNVGEGIDAEDTDEMSAFVEELGDYLEDRRIISVRQYSGVMVQWTVPGYLDGESPTGYRTYTEARQAFRDLIAEHTERA